MPHILFITSVICGYFLIRVSALHFYGVGGISGYTREDEDQARTDSRNIIHMLWHWIPAYGLLNFLMGEDIVQKKLVTSCIVLACVTCKRCGLWVMSLHWDVSLLQSEEIHLFCCSLASFPPYFLGLQMLLFLTSIMPDGISVSHFGNPSLPMLCLILGEILGELSFQADKLVVGVRSECAEQLLMGEMITVLRVLTSAWLNPSWAERK